MTDQNLQKQMNVLPGARIGAFIFATIMMAAIAMVVMALIAHGDADTQRLRIATVIQDVLMFVVPPILTAVIVCRLPSRLLLIEKPRRVTPFVWIVVALIVSIPAMNCVIAWNESLTLPDFLAGIDNWMRSAEAEATRSVNTLMGGGTAGDLIMNLLIIGILAGFSEELFFRGGLQQLLVTRPMNVHAAIWITAFVFSAIHLQFFGFFPRFLLGAYFGYLAYWSHTIWLPVTAHILNNSVVVVTSWLAQRGAVTSGIDKFGAEASSVPEIATVCISVLATAAVIVCIYRSCRANTV